MAFWNTAGDKRQIKHKTGMLKISPERRTASEDCFCSASLETSVSYRTWLFITAFTTASHRSIYWERRIHFKHCPTIYIIPLLILSWLTPTSSNQSLIFRYSSKNPHQFHTSSCLLPDALNIPPFDHYNSWQAVILLILQSSFFAFSHYQVPFTPSSNTLSLCSSLDWNTF